MTGQTRRSGGSAPDGAASTRAAAALALMAAFALTALQARAAQSADGCAALPSLAVVIALDDSSRTTRTFDAGRELRGFALYSYRNIAGDLVNGRGPYLDALVDPFRAACTDNDSLIAWLREMLAGSGSATEFSRRIGVALATVRTAEGAQPLAAR